MQIYPIRNQQHYTILTIKCRSVRWRDILPHHQANRFESVLNDFVEAAAAAMIESGSNPSDATNAAVEIGATVRQQLELKSGRTPT
jgi:hypothetical protein